MFIYDFILIWCEGGGFLNPRGPVDDGNKFCCSVGLENGQDVAVMLSTVPSRFLKQIF